MNNGMRSTITSRRRTGRRCSGGVLRYLPGGSPEAVLWILKTGAQWHLQPQCYSNYKTVQRKFQT